MKEQYEDAYTDEEERHPWFVARRALFVQLARHAGLDTQSRIIDVGCGTGVFLAHLKRLGFQHLVGMDPSARLRARRRDPTIPIHAEMPDQTFDAVLLMDVLEHIADDTGTLARVHAALRPGGTLLISVPAHPFLWGPHDELNLHERRYRGRELRDKLRSAGFVIDRFGYWNMFAFPAAYLVRRLGLGSADAGNIGLGPPVALWCYGLVLRVENWLMRWFDLPVGISLIATAHAAPGGKVPSAR